jgi:hypothetical protein
MSECKFCGQPAGLFRKKHKECERKHDLGWATMVGDCRLAVLGDGDSGTLQQRLSETAAASYVDADKAKDAMIEGWGIAVDQFLNDGALDENEEKKLVDFSGRFGLNQEMLDRGGAWTKVVKGAVIRDLLNGVVPQRMKLTGGLPFNFMASEQLAWVFTGVKYLEDKTRRHYVGGSQGMSVRIAKGLYYRASAFRGDPVETTERVHVDTGTLAVTTKHVYFGGPAKSFRIRHDKIVSITPYSDGVAIHRDAQTAKPQIFVTGDGWFTNNLLANIGNIAGR